jgi:hypothetical protein
MLTEQLGAGLGDAFVRLRAYAYFNDLRLTDAVRDMSPAACGCTLTPPGTVRREALARSRRGRSLPGLPRRIMPRFLRG